MGWALKWKPLHSLWWAHQWHNQPSLSRGAKSEVKEPSRFLPFLPDFSSFSWFFPFSRFFPSFLIYSLFYPNFPSFFKFITIKGALCPLPHWLRYWLPQNREQVTFWAKQSFWCHAFSFKFGTKIKFMPLLLEIGPFVCETFSGFFGSAFMRNLPLKFPCQNSNNKQNQKM